MCNVANVPVDDSRWVEDLSKFDEGFIKSDTENLHNARNNLPLLPEGMKIEKVENFVADLNDRNEYIIHIRTKIWRKSNILLPGYRQ